MKTPDLTLERKSDKSGTHLFKSIFKCKKNERTRDSDEESLGSNSVQEMTSKEKEIAAKWDFWGKLLQSPGFVRTALQSMSPEIKKGLCEGRELDPCVWKKFVEKLEASGSKKHEIKVDIAICLNHLLDMFRCFNVLVEKESCKVNSGGVVEAEQHVWDSVARESPKSMFFRSNACPIFGMLEEAFSAFETTSLGDEPFDPRIHPSSSHKKAKLCHTSIDHTFAGNSYWGRVEEKQNVFEKVCNQIAEAKPTPQRFLIALGKLAPRMNPGDLHRESFPFFPRYVKEYWINNLPSSSETEIAEVGESPL